MTEFFVWILVLAAVVAAVVLYYRRKRPAKNEAGSGGKGEGRQVEK